MDKQRLIQAIEQFKNKKIAVVGDVALDKYIFGKIERVNPENPAAPLIKIERKEFRLGCAGNVALNIGSLGSDVSLGCVIGHDHNGSLFENLCMNKKINLLHIKDGETIVKERTIESEFNKYLLRVDDGESILEGINDESSNKLFDLLLKAEVDALILSDYNKFIFKNGLGKKLIEWAREKNLLVVVDPKPINAISFSGASVLCPNIKEAREITEMNNENEMEVAKRLREIVKSKYVIVTCGKKGMVCYDGKEFTEIPTKVREVVDVTGAGDTVSAVLTLALTSGLSLIEAAHLANYAAGIVVEKLGTSTLTKEELIARIESDDKL